MPARIRSISLAAALVLAASSAVAAQSTPPPASPNAADLLGFAAPRAAEQIALEQRFDAGLNPADLETWMHRLAARPHHLGSPGSKANAEYIAELFRSWGYQVAIEEFQALFPTPTERRVEMVAPRKHTASLVEDPLREDSTSGQTAEQLPTFNAYSIDGDVTAEVVYVNYGVPEDYEELARRGVDVKGKIALARYGRSWRGIKPKVAAEHGAVGCLIFSDPAEDGYGAGDAYPQGGFRPSQGAQRGSVVDMPVYSGDPLTPGVGATKDAKRLDRSQLEVLTKIPVLPISARDAQPMLENLAGPVVPAAWRGALPIAYHFGPGPAKVRLKLAFDWKLAPVYDVIAKLPGAELPDQWIVRGNHHDAWVNGATDPTSGMIALMAEAKAIGELAREGFRPRRTLVFAAWDGEEQGLIGSTEWAEAHAEELSRKAVVYLNGDSNSRGFVGAGGSHALETMVNQVFDSVTDPQKGVSVAARARALDALSGSPEEQKAAREGKPLALGALGSGSDYTPFLQHLGIASLDVRFGGEGDYGQYHSIYDSIDHFERFMDPGYRYGVALAQVSGRIVLRLAQADVLPFDPTPLASTVTRYVDEVVKLADSLREQTETERWRVEQKVYENAADPDETLVVQPAKDPVPFLNFAPLQNAAAALTKSTELYRKARASRLSGDAPLPAADAAAIDAILIGTERAMLRDSGLPGRSWYRHHLYAPGFYTGYGVKTLPAVREPIELRRWDEAAAGIEATAAALASVTEQIDRATAVWAKE
ncbi:MAG TPA: transferrin receptor-like dimerization domain-containing protein [Thermoanaerobaculia bacterium]|nr:transferrin receptor-like dimerization domain-containing protein [Thermoanaerobaculia bacterium]